MVTVAGAVIEAPARDDRREWERLYRAYAEFYRVPMTNDILDTVWGWIHDPAHEVRALVARAGSDLAGLAHFRPYARPLRGVTGMFLDDLFVDPAARGDGLGTRLIEAVAEEARARGFGLLRWITADDNYRARTAYDRIARRTTWITYDMDLTAR